MLYKIQALLMEHGNVVCVHDEQDNVPLEKFGEVMMYLALDVASESILEQLTFSVTPM